MSDKQKLKIEEAHQKLADLTETLEREKVELTPEIKAYVDENVRMVHEMLQNGEPIYPANLKFIENIKLWVEFKGEVTLEQIDSKQFKGVLFMAKEAEKDVDWIEEHFVIDGGKIICKGDLSLKDCTGLTKLPEGLKVGKSLELFGCIRLTELPEGLSVGRNLNLGCTGLIRLPEVLTIRGFLSLGDCLYLTKLPESLEVGGDLYLIKCTGLTKLPDGLTVGEKLYLTDDLNEQVKADAERLKKEGKINEIKYV